MREATDTGRQTKPRFLSKILGDASQLGLIVRSPVALVNAPTAAGARRGEVAGLTWDDVDLDGYELHIDWTLGHVGHGVRWKPRPKSEAGKRTIALDPATVDALREHRREQLEQRHAAADVWQEAFTDSAGLSRSELLWTNGDGSPIHPKTWYERFLRLSAEAGLPRIRLRDVRHTYATAVLEAAEGWHDVKLLSQRLGHKSVGTTPRHLRVGTARGRGPCNGISRDHGVTTGDENG